MKQIWILFLVGALALTACGPEAAPTLSPADVQATAVAAAMSMVAETQAAIPPTPTELPPTIPPPPSLTPTTSGLLLLPTTSGDGMLTPTSIGGLLLTNTPPAPVSTSTCNQPLMKWDGPSARLNIKNNTKPKGVVTLSLFFTTERGQCGYIGAQFENSITLTVPVGTFQAGAFVDGTKDFKVFGSGQIKVGSSSLWIENEAIILKAGCAPDC